MQFSAPRLALLLGVAACKPDIPEPIWKGEHLFYSTTTNEPVCRGSFYRQEQHVVGLAEMLDLDLPDPIHYTRIARSQAPEYCEGLAADGCAYVDSPYVFAVRNFNLHELSHAVAYLNGIEGPTPFEEGFAEVFNDSGDPDTVQAPLDDVLRGFSRDDPNYHTAGLFARFLIERHSLEQFVQFLREAGPDASFDAFTPVFLRVFDEPIDEAMADFEDYPACAEMSNRIAVVDCSLPVQPWEDGVVTLTANLACDQDDVIGPDQKNVMFTTRGFQVDEAGSYLFYASMPEGWSGFRVVKCGSCWDAFDVGVEPGGMEAHELTPGRYYVLFGRNVDEPAELGLAVGQL